MERLRIVTRGRPRSAEAHAAILAAAIELVRETGYDAVTMEAIAARARVGKATLYRRWNGKETLVAEGIARIVASLPVPDTGCVRRDLLALMRSTVALYDDPATLALLSGLVAAMARSRPIAQAVRAGFIAAWRRAAREVLARGVARRQLRRGLDLELAVDVFGGYFTNRALITGAPINERGTRVLVDTLLRGFGERT